MPGLLRYAQKLFGINAGTNQMSKYGSRIQSPPGQRYNGSTITPAIVQELSAFQDGQYAAMAGAKSPFIEDHNSLFYLAFYQLSYLLTRGIPEWDSSTTYNTNDYCKVGNIIYYSLIDNNLNNDPTISILNWTRLIKHPTYTIIQGSGSSTYITPSPSPLFIRVQLCGGGGGGRGSGTNVGGGGPGSDGGDSSFGTSFITATGGKGATTSVGGPPGNGTFIFPAIGISKSGQYGSAGSIFSMPAGASYSLDIVGGDGGQSLFSGAGTSNPGVSAGGDAVNFTGAGGAGAGISFTSSSGFNVITGPGGGGGGYVDVIIPSPSSTYPVFLGDKGLGGAAGSNGQAGGNGSQSILIVTEYYQ